MMTPGRTLQADGGSEIYNHCTALRRGCDHAFLANHLRLFYSCAGYVLIHSLRENTLVRTELAKAQPVSIILKLFKLAVRVIQYKDRIKLSLPSACPMKGVLARVTELLYLVPRLPAPA
jgi:hypothetical protein